MTKAHLVLADGRVFSGQSFGSSAGSVGELVFTTGMTGYQEVITDPSFAGQIVTMTAPHIGNTGTNAEDEESTKPQLAAFVCHQAAELVSNWRSTETLDAYLKRHGVVGLSGVDTRALTHHIRTHGAQMAAIGTESIDVLLERARSAASMAGQDLTGRVATKTAFVYRPSTNGWLGELPMPSLRVVAVDLGMKRNILQLLARQGCEVQVVPPTTSAEEILGYGPDGIFLSNGPGDPAAVTHVIETTRALLGKKPIFGICLGHQILGLALGGKTFKLKFGHRGLNHPVKEVATGRIDITAQNHGFAVDGDSLTHGYVSHVHLNDGTCQGIACDELRAFGVQFHPEASAGPHDAEHLFGRFSQWMRSPANLG